jgi:hypothetical protein
MVALAIGMGGAIILLLIGTQILEWYWVVALAVVSLGVGLYRLRKHIPSKYKLAQRIDRRLMLADALSTATYFASPEAEGEPAIRERQREEAERIARTVDVRAALPMTRPRYLYPATALAAAAIVLFAVRFAVTGKLDLEPSLVKIAFDTFFQPKQLAQNQKQPDRMKAPPLDQGDPDAPTTESDKTPDSPIDTEDPPDYSNPQAGDNSKDAAKANDPNPDQADVDQGDKGDKQQKGNDDSQNDSKDSKSGDQKDGKQDSKQASSNDSSSLMDKIKDAMANMLNKMKPSSAQEGQQSQQNAQKDQQSGQQQKGQKGDQQKQAENSNSDAQSDQSQDDQKQSADAKGAEKSSDKNASQDSKSGIGSADGDKSAKEAEQLKAMGKISEILGKRAQNVTGEVMVEVGSSKQQLKTPWAQKDAAHTDAGSEIHRDEVPLMYQQYVEQYFEQIRKSGEAAKKPEKQR